MQIILCLLVRFERYFLNRSAFFGQLYRRLSHYSMAIVAVAVAVIVAVDVGV